jgi:hypothetical protein
VQPCAPLRTVLQGAQPLLNLAHKGNVVVCNEHPIRDVFKGGYHLAELGRSFWARRLYGDILFVALIQLHFSRLENVENSRFCTRHLNF